MGKLTKQNPHGIVQVRINRNSGEDGFWHKHSDYYDLERVISNVVSCEGLMFQGFEVKPEKVMDMAAELRLSDDLFEQLYDYFNSEELEFKQAGGLLVTVSLSVPGELGKLTIKEEEQTSWTFYPDEILDVVAAPKQPTVKVTSQDELDSLLSEEGEKARRKREKAIAAIRAASMAQMNAASLGLNPEPVTTEETKEKEIATAS